MNLLNAIYKSLDNIMEYGMPPNAPGWPPQPTPLMSPPAIGFPPPYGQPMMNPAAQMGLMQQMQAHPFFPKQPKPEKEDSSGIETSDILKYLLGLGAVAGGGYGIYKMNQPTFAEKALDGGANFLKVAGPMNKPWLIPWVKEKFGNVAANNISGMIDVFSGNDPTQSYQNSYFNSEEEEKAAKRKAQFEKKYGKQLDGFEDSSGRFITRHLYNGAQYNFTQDEIGLKLREIRKIQNQQHSILGNANSSDDEKKAAKTELERYKVLELRRQGKILQNEQFKNIGHAEKLLSAGSTRSAQHAANVKAKQNTQQQATKP